MVKRKSRKVKSRKKARKAVRRTVRRKTTRRKVARKRKMSSKNMGTPSHEAVIEKNKKAHWAVYLELQKKADKAWAKLRHDVKRKAPSHVLLEDRNELLLLLGECHYLAGECMRSTMNRS